MNMNYATNRLHRLQLTNKKLHFTIIFKGDGKGKKKLKNFFIFYFLLVYIYTKCYLYRHPSVYIYIYIYTHTRLDFHILLVVHEGKWMSNEIAWVLYMLWHMCLSKILLRRILN